MGLYVVKKTKGEKKTPSNNDEEIGRCENNDNMWVFLGFFHQQLHEKEK